MRGGKDYEADFRSRMKGEGLWADLLKQRFQKAVKRIGLNERARGILDFSQFHAPQRVKEAARAGAGTPQLNLF